MPKLSDYRLYRCARCGLIYGWPPSDGGGLSQARQCVCGGAVDELDEPFEGVSTIAARDHAFLIGTYHEALEAALAALRQWHWLRGRPESDSEEAWSIYYRSAPDLAAVRRIRGDKP